MPMRSFLSQLLAVGPELTAFILTSPLLGAHAIPQTLAPSPNLDLSQLGRVAVVGDFDSLALYSYVGQNENTLSNNGSQSLLTQYDNGAFDSLAVSDAYIEAMCQFSRNGKVQGVVVGGNFTSLGGVEAQSIALWDPNTNGVTPLPGINGMVSSLYCDDDAGIVYVGGMFTAGNSENAMAWITNWENLPFAGFNGPVNSIAKDSAGNIVFGGAFDGLGNTTGGAAPSSSSSKYSQVVNLSGGNITAEGSTTDTGFSDPSNVICQTGTDQPGTSWLLSDNRGGFWQGSYGFGFVPTKLRLYNTKYQGRGTKTWSFENLDNAGVLEFNYIASDGTNQSCASNCPLPEGKTTAQDFYFSNPIGFNNFRIWIESWYGSGGGFSGIELFQDDIYSFAVNDFNEPTCDGVSKAAFSTVNPATGLWNRMPNNGATNSDFLSAYLTDASQVTGTSVVFSPNIDSSGNYSITMYTPGCLADNSCSTRGSVNVTGSMTSNAAPVSTVVSQTNDYDKYDLIYYGPVDTDISPAVTLSPMANQPLPQTIVAQRVRFDLVTTTGGLNGLYEYNPNKATVDKDFSDSAINSAGAKLNSAATVNAVVTYKGQTIVGGKLSGDGIANVFSISNKANSLSSGGLNAEVQTLYLSESNSILYVGGNFTNTGDNSVKGLANVASYDLSSNKWSALGAGVDGTVRNIVPIELNITSGDLESCITVNGDFSTVNAYGSNAAFAAKGLAVWVPSKNDWLNNIPNADVAVSGRLFTSIDVNGMQWPLYAGQAAVQPLGLGGAAELVGSGQPSLQALGVKIQSGGSTSSSSKHKRAEQSIDTTPGVYTGLFYGENDLNITIFGGHFTASASDGSNVQNLVIVKDSGSQQTVSGVSQLDTNSTVTALAFQNTLLFAGGSLSGNIDGTALNGLVVYDLQKGAVASPQPPALAGTDVVVNAIAPQTDSNLVFVGGNFDDAGLLPCATLCYYDTSVKQWNTPGIGLTGTITSMMWSSKTTLIIAGNLTVHGNKTSMASYDSKKQIFSDFTTAAPLPGAISALTPADGKYSNFWAAGIASNNNSAYLSYYSDDKWTGVGGLGPGTIIRGLQVLSVTSDHDSTDLVPSNEVLMVIGNINIPSFGNASACLFNGTTFEPFMLTNNNDGTQGSAASIFVSNPQNLMKLGGGPLAIGFVVLIGLAIALGLIFLIVVAGILMERARRRREGYIPMPSDKNNGNLSRIPPETLLGGLKEKSNPPKI